ncbi:MAG: peptidyl-tRNA hydrolase Pth2 [Candidatus Aenigmatarchaeota archaeon]
MYKQVIVVRKDLKLGVGKIAAQVAHAAIGSLKKANKNISEIWEKEGAKKIVVKVNSLEKLKEIYKKVKKEKIPCFLVRDAGLTQVKKGTITALGIGPDKEDKIDKITGKLKLL